MRHATRFLAEALLLLTAGAARAAGERGFTVEVLVDGSPRPEYAARGTLYIEALRDRSYTLRLHNPLGCRVAVALAVDGLNTIDARHTEAWDARKWVLEPYETVEIPGWQVSGSHAREFTFTGEKGSYGAALGETDNLGVIEAVFYREKLRPRPPVVYDPPPRRDDGPFHWLLPGELPTAPAPEARREAGAAAESRAQKEAPALSDEYAGTGMGGRTHHEVTEVELELEESPAARARVRYEFRPVLVRLGVLPHPCPPRPLERREGASGFEVGYCPEPDRRR